MEEKKDALLFYDIESLENVFTCAFYSENKDFITLFYLIDDDKINDLLINKFVRDDIINRICEVNKQFTNKENVQFINLRNDNGVKMFAKYVGVSLSKNICNINEPDRLCNQYRITCDTDSTYDSTKYPYIMGYNSYNYDTTMLALFFFETLVTDDISMQNGKVIPTTAKNMRRLNDMLFTPEYKNNMSSILSDTPHGGKDFNSESYLIRKNMLLSGRHLDVARLNEKQQKVGLKRLCGMLGLQIKESDRLKDGNAYIRDIDDFKELIAYNCSDIINLRNLFFEKTYQAGFSLKKQMLKTYPELIYNKKSDEYKPDMKTVRNDRLTIDSSSAQFSTKCLCPYGKLTDIEYVSFMYPSENKAKELGIERKNILDETKSFFEKLYPNRPDLHKEFERIYKYYKTIEGKNFNDTPHYVEVYGDDEKHLPHTLSSIKGDNLFLPYYDKNGNETSCYVLFSTGGIHGAEYNKQLYDKRMNDYNKLVEIANDLRKKYNNPKDVKRLKEITINGENLKTSLFVKDDVYSDIGWLDYSYEKEKIELLRKIQNEIKDVTYNDISLAKKMKTYMYNTNDAKECEILDELSTFNKDFEKININNYEIKTKQFISTEKTDNIDPALLTKYKNNPQVKILKKETYFWTNFDNIKNHLDDAKQHLNYVISEYKTPEKVKKLKKLNLCGKEYKSEDFIYSNRKTTVIWKDLSENKPKVFKEGEKGVEFNKEYTFTSNDMSNHEDFTSYYPNLLRMMEAFYNDGLKYDRYAEIFNQKEEYGKLRKDKSISKEERDFYNILRNGTKLILNSASGAADARFINNIRVNNQIISMRIIGQLFSWRIGQAQAYHGAKMISTNTDGLYSVMEEEINDKILKEQSKEINVEIEPEPLYLISKDANNRIELKKDLSIISASGATLGCRKGPDPEKSLAHPAVIDWALAEYLILTARPESNIKLTDKFNYNIGKNLIKRRLYEFDGIKRLTMFQNMITSSPNTIKYNFATNVDTKEVIPLQHYNRIFILKDKTPNTYHLESVAARVVSVATRKSRRNKGERETTIDKKAYDILKMYEENIPTDRDIIIQKITGVDPESYVFIENSDLRYITKEEENFIINNLDLDTYTKMLQDTFENNWMNATE